MSLEKRRVKAVQYFSDPIRSLRGSFLSAWIFLLIATLSLMIAEGLFLGAIETGSEELMISFGAVWLLVFLLAPVALVGAASAFLRQTLRGSKTAGLASLGVLSAVLTGWMTLLVLHLPSGVID